MVKMSFVFVSKVTSVADQLNSSKFQSLLTNASWLSYSNRMKKLMVKYQKICHPLSEEYDPW